MATARKWSNVAVAMQSALGATKTISGITKAAPGVVTSTAHGLTNGTYVFLEIQGMYQLNNTVYRIASVATDTFQLEDVSGGTGIDTTAFDTFTSGTAKAITFGTTISAFTGLSASGGDLNFIRTTTIHQNQETQIPGTTNPIVYNFDSIWDVTDAGLAALKTAYAAGAQRAFRFTFGTGGPIMVFVGYVGASLAPVGSAGELVSTPAAITLYGAPTYYSA